MPEKTVYSVGQINHYIRRMFEQDILLHAFYVRGEISNCKYHTSGHIYFSLKDETGTLSCVMFRGDRKGLAFPMKDGDRVIVGGSVSVYEKTGSYQLYAKEIELEGAGLLYERFLRLKQELEDMGMFDPLYKKPIPRYARRVGVITAPTGAAVRDIMTIAHRRNPYVQLILYPAIVQGKEAAPSLVKGLGVLDRAGVDIIIIGRGGGSLEDLWAFNEESVARAVFECETPVISAVGHETDTTITDFVADLRAPTPSAAAELAVFSVTEFDRLSEEKRRRLTLGVTRRIDRMRAELRRYSVRFEYLSPQNRLNEKKKHAADLAEAFGRLMTEKLQLSQRRSSDLSLDLKDGMNTKYRNVRHGFELLLERFKGLNPLDKLRQGFSYAEDKNGKALKSVGQVQSGDPVDIHVTDGQIRAIVKETHLEVRPEA